MKFLKYFVSLCVILASTSSWAGSVLSSYGVGLHYRYASARSLGMGGAEIANYDPFSISRLNPAANIHLRSTTLNLQFAYDGYNFEDQGGSGNDGYANLDGFQFAVPVSHKFSFRIGLQPWTRMQYHLTESKSLQGEDYIKRYKGKGGINALDFSIAYAPIPKLTFGITGHYLFGDLNETFWVDYESNDFQYSINQYRTQNRGITATLGLMLQVNPRLSFGAIYTPKTTLINKTYYASVFSTEIIKIDGETVMPSVLGFGFQVLPKKTWRIAGDYEIQKWSEFSITNRNYTELRDVQRIALGTEYLPSVNPLASYIKKITYRAGFSYSPFFAEDPDGNTISETWLTVGAGIPFFLNLSKVDVSFGIGRRGSLDTNGFAENLVRLSLSITGNERWFLRRY